MGNLSPFESTGTNLDYYILIGFLTGTIADYGGQLGFKRAAFSMLIIYILFTPRVNRIYKMVAQDLLIFLAVPITIILSHLLFDQGTDPGDILTGVWLCLGAPAYYLCVPLVFLVGAERSAKILIYIFVIHAIIGTLVTIIHASGLVDLYQYSDFFSNGVGVLGSDSRATQLEGPKLALPRLGGYQAYPLIFILALGISPINSIILLMATIITAERGLIIGILFALIIMIRPLIDKFHNSISGEKTRKKLKILLWLTIVISSLVFFVVIAPYLSQIFELLMIKFSVINDINDSSVSIRLGHIDGYMNRLYINPFGLLFGFGPLATIYNPITTEYIKMTEMVILIYSLWYGVIYTSLFYSWLGINIYCLYRRILNIFDTSLCVSIAIMIIIGNINPLMHMPIAFIFLAMLRVRTIEISYSEMQKKK